MSFTYLASPYTPLNGESVEDRVTAVCKYAAKLMEEGHAVFSPIVHSHYIADHLDEARRMDHDFWMKQDLTILQSARELVVLCLPGWEFSRGVKKEIETAECFDIPITYVTP